MNVKKIIKAQAREKLRRNCYPLAIAAFFSQFCAVLLIIFSMGFMTTLVSLLNSFLKIETYFEVIRVSALFAGFCLGFIPAFPMLCGAKKVYYSIAKEEDAQLSYLFYYFKNNFFKCLSLGVRYTFLYIFKLVLTCILPTIIAYNLVYSFSKYLESIKRSDAGVSFIIVYIVFFGGLILWHVWKNKHNLSLYLFIEDEGYSASEYMNLSKRILSPSLRRERATLPLGFIGWIFFSFTGVGMIYTIPYYETAIATSAMWMIKLDKDVK